MHASPPLCLNLMWLPQQRKSVAQCRQALRMCLFLCLCAPFTKRQIQSVTQLVIPLARHVRLHPYVTSIHIWICVCLSVWGQSCVTWKGQKYKCANINKQALGAQIHMHTKHPYPDSVLLSCASDCQSLHKGCYTSCVIMALWLVESNTGQLRERSRLSHVCFITQRDIQVIRSWRRSAYVCVCARVCRLGEMIFH